MILKSVLETVFLGICLITDIRSRKIYAGLCALFFCLGISMQIFLYGEPVTYMAVSVIPGVVMLLAAFMSKGRVGYGDCAVMVVTGIVYGIRITVNVCMTAFFILSLYCLIMVLCRRKRWNDEIPFMPFLMAGNLFVIINGGVI